MAVDAAPGSKDAAGVHLNTADCDCAQCNGDLWLSAVVSPAAPGVAVCPEHADVSGCLSACPPAVALPPGCCTEVGQILWCVGMLGCPSACRCLPACLPACHLIVWHLLPCPPRAGAGTAAWLPAGQPFAAVPPFPTGTGCPCGSSRAESGGRSRSHRCRQAAAAAHRRGARAGGACRCVYHAPSCCAVLCCAVVPACLPWEH
jgi:hypothetical protein